MDYKPEDTEFLTKLGAEPSKYSVHGVPDDIRERLKPLKTSNWKQQGNTITCQTEMGVLAQQIPTNYLLIGEDAQGRPLLKKIVL